MDTPYLTHIEKLTFNFIYEPAEDSFLLIDALEKDLDLLRAKKPTFCLEVGSGSGVVITAIAKAIPNTFCMSTDINQLASFITKATAEYNTVMVDQVGMDLASGFVDNKFDIIVCNPPYVETESEECGSRGIAASWAGGFKGREMIDRLLDMVPKKLAPDGIFYLLLLEDNIPEEVIDIMAKHGFKSETVLKRTARNEEQLVLKFFNLNL